MKTNIRNILIIVVLLLALAGIVFLSFRTRIQSTVEKELLTQIDNLTAENKSEVKRADSLNTELVIMAKQKAKITVIHNTKRIKELENELNLIKDKREHIKIDSIPAEELDIFLKELFK